MGKLQGRVEQNLKQALKEKAEDRLSALRLFKADLQYEMAKTGAKSLEDSIVESIAKRAVKKRRESIEQYEKAGRDDLLAKEKAGLAVLEDYLPPPVSEDELLQIIEKAYSSVKPLDPKDMGKLMGAVMGQLKGRTVDGSHVRSLIQRKLEA